MPTYEEYDLVVENDECGSARQGTSLPLQQILLFVLGFKVC